MTETKPPPEQIIAECLTVLGAPHEEAARIVERMAAHDAALLDQAEAVYRGLEHEAKLHGQHVATASAVLAMHETDKATREPAELLLGGTLEPPPPTEEERQAEFERAVEAARREIEREFGRRR